MRPVPGQTEQVRSAFGEAPARDGQRVPESSSYDPTRRRQGSRTPCLPERCSSLGAVSDAERRPPWGVFARVSRCASADPMGRGRVGRSHLGFGRSRPGELAARDGLGGPSARRDPHWTGVRAGPPQSRPSGGQPRRRLPGARVDFRTRQGPGWPTAGRGVLSRSGEQGDRQSACRRRSTNSGGSAGRRDRPIMHVAMKNRSAKTRPRAAPSRR